jgi:DNA-binding GntR family transcriptional regulator
MGDLQEFTINQTKISDQVYEYLRGEIISGRLAPGERLDLDRIVEQLKVSKMPIKEALGRLAGEGLVDIQSRRGTYVGRVDARDLAETFEVRRALEMLAGLSILVRSALADLPLGERLDRELVLLVREMREPLLRVRLALARVVAQVFVSAPRSVPLLYAPQSLSLRAHTLTLT